MAITDFLSIEDPEVRESLDRLFSRKVLGSVVVGKFLGDYLAILTTGALGVHLGYGLGITISILVFVFWERVERAAQTAQNKASQSQTSISDFGDQ